ncbi:MAG: carboxypeptidase-like regulatory domain-containing protein, partial [Acidobacteriota bacterium]
MPKQSHKSVAVRTCALACVVGLSLNTLVIASPSARRLSGSARTSSEALARELMPEPSPTPVKPGMSPAKDNMATQAGQGRQYGQSGFIGESINLNVVNADIRLTHIATGASRRSNTNERGDFTFSSVVPGEYSVA